MYLLALLGRETVDAAAAGGEVSGCNTAMASRRSVTAM
jgi:hypothetical protein